MKYQRLTAVFTLLCFSPFSHADTYLPQSAGDMLWLMFAAALVFFMQAGFALLEAGATRSKNAVNVIMKNFSDVALGSIAFFTVGFGLMFGNNLFGWFGTSMFFLNDATEWDYGVALFQMMFAATAVTIASGAMAERTRFGAYLVAACVVTAVIYPVFGSWAWGGAYGGSGWLADLGFIDFAGSTVVHSVGAWVALAGILVVGPRTGRFDSQGKPHQITGHNMTFVALGGLILWLGWFGFNAGSTLTADMSVGKISLNTHLSASSGLAGAWLLSRMLGKPTFTATLVNGSLGGLVAITAGCASMEPLFALLTGFIGGMVVVLSQMLMLSLKLDDVVGAIPVHGFAGIWGTLAAGLFYSGDLFNPQIVTTQLIGIGACFVWTFSTSYIVYRCVSFFTPLRADSLHEQRGLDITEHAELGYPEFQADTAYDQETLNRLNNQG